jgi:hypothetical protein
MRLRSPVLIPIIRYERCEMYKRILTLLLPVFVSLAAVIHSVTPVSAAPPYPCATRWERYGEEL